MASISQQNPVRLFVSHAFEPNDDYLRVLRESGFATVRADGPRRIYEVAALPLEEIDSWLSQFRQLWAQRLDALATEVARGKRARRK